MFEQLFLGAMRRGPRILFLAALVMLTWGLAYIGWVLSNAGMTGPSLAQQGGWIGAILSTLHASFAPAAYLFFAALVVHHLEEWGRRDKTQ